MRQGIIYLTTEIKKVILDLCALANKTNDDEVKKLVGKMRRMIEENV